MTLTYSAKKRFDRIMRALRSAEIEEGEITTDKLGDGVVTTAKLANSAVTASKIAEGAVTSPRLANGAVTKSKVSLEVVNVTISGTSTAGSVDISDADSQILGVFQSAVSGGAGAIPVKSVAIDAENEKVTITLDAEPGEGKSITYTVVLIKP